MKWRFLLVILCSGFSTLAQDAVIFKPDSLRRTLEAIPVSGNLRIDGQLNEAIWQSAKPSPSFIQIEPNQGTTPGLYTNVKALYNKQFLYLGVFCYDSAGKKAIRATDFKRDFNNRQHDHLAFSFDGFNDHRNAMAFYTNAYGVQRDLLSFDDINYDLDWDGLWKVRTTRTDSGWYAEIAIPWQTFRYPKNGDSLQYWGFNMYRNRRLSNETTAFSPYPRSVTFMRMAYAGSLTNLRPPPPKPNIRIQPYILSSYDHYNNFPASQKPTVTSLKVGGDIKWAINPNTVMDLTVNTDFAQADADRQVNNVTRFSVFFPERRQFFLENASMFGVGVGPNEDLSGGNMRIRPFFSRRIGLDDSGNPIPIEAGGRLVYRSTKRNAGVLAIRQRGYNGSDPTNFFVGRFSENFGEQNRIGGLVTIKNQSGGTNIVSAVDGFFRLG
ncbi:MAG: carbohydrate binding family 9 domain-containing protein, partial [Chitinophagaceae bacterium]|nr:carbohydrate binding family 9 domain-containing protein [Chitinophagaceae bacterium]